MCQWCICKLTWLLHLLVTPLCSWLPVNKQTMNKELWPSCINEYREANLSTLFVHSFVCSFLCFMWYACSNFRVIFGEQAWGNTGFSHFNQNLHYPWLFQDERELRMSALRRRERTYDVHKWVQSFLCATGTVENDDRDSHLESLTIEHFEKWLACYVDDSSKLVLLLDYDGTLAPIAQHPDEAHLPKDTRSVRCLTLLSVGVHLFMNGVNFMI